MKRIFASGLALLALQLWLPTAAAADFPDRPIRMVIGFPPGGGNDIVGRIVAQKMAALMGQPVVVDNKPGAAGDIAAELVARAAPDGYTMLLIPNTSVLSAALTRRPLKYDIMKDFTPLALLSVAPMVVVSNPQFQVGSFRELLATARANSGKINHGTAGVGTQAYIAGEWLNALTGANIVAVPYRGTGPALTGLLGNEVQMMFTPLSGVEGFVKEKRLRLLANMGDRRLAAYPDVPTVMESGVPGFDVSLWYGLVAPAGVPAAVVARYESALKQVLTDPATAGELEGRGAPARYGSSQEFGRLMAEDLAHWREIGRNAKIVID
jgi:tripartite-type tricarboxylate transporter receptor subunit TctC